MNVDKIIDDSHFKSFKHVRDVIKKSNPDIKVKEINAIIKKRLNDRHLRQHQKRP